MKIVVVIVDGTEIAKYHFLLARLFQAYFFISSSSKIRSCCIENGFTGISGDTSGYLGTSQDISGHLRISRDISLQNTM